MNSAPNNEELFWLLTCDSHLYFGTGLTSAVLLGLKSPLLMSATSLGAALVGIAAAYLAQGLFGAYFASVLPVVAYLTLLALD